MLRTRERPPAPPPVTHTYTGPQAVFSSPQAVYSGPQAVYSGPQAGGRPASRFLNFCRSVNYFLRPRAFFNSDFIVVSIPEVGSDFF